MTMTFRPVVAGTTDVSAIIRIVDSTDGTPETGVVYNTSGIDIRYRRDGATDTAITEATLAALDTAHSDGGFLHIGNGYYRIDLPDAACASGANGVLVHGTVTGMVVIGTYIPLVAVNPYDTVRMGLTALPNVASGNSGAIPTVGTGTAQISVSGGRAAADVTYWNGSVLTGKTGAFPEFGIIDSGTAQSATGTTLVLRSAAAFADDELNGATILIVSASTGAGQRRVINDYVGSTDTATVDTWTTTPTGTIVYAIFGSPPASVGLPVPANMTQILGTAVSTPATAGILDVNVKNIDNDAASASGTVTFPNATLASTTNITAGTITTATNVTTVNGLAANVITAAATAADFGTEVGTAVWATTTRSLTVLDEDSTTLDLDATIRAAVGMASANLDTQLTAIDDYLDTEVAAIKTKTDQLVFTKANELDVNVQSINGATVTGDGNATPWDGA